MRRSSLLRLARILPTLVFGAFPATWLILDARGPVFHENWLLVVLGMVGLWRISFQEHFVSRFNFYLLALGLAGFLHLILWEFVKWSLFPPYRDLGQNWPRLTLLLAPATTSLVYLVAMVVLHRRTRAPDRSIA